LGGDIAARPGGISVSAMNSGIVEITPEILLRAYAAGIFPMAENAEDPSLYWVEPRERGIIPLDGFHVGKRLARTVRSDIYTIRFDHDFDGVISGCAQPGVDREKTWINRRIRQLYGELFDLGFCHTVEAYEGDRLVGGLYGVSLGAAFFGESMFHNARDASKVALVHLVARLGICDYKLLDTQFVTDHLAQFGAYEIPRRNYKALLAVALAQESRWDAWPDGEMSGARVLDILARRD
jgi:leucyl/phenylalanyl-tRNA---protein transferase